jgi:hypothetical protein
LAIDAPSPLIYFCIEVQNHNNKIIQTKGQPSGSPIGTMARKRIHNRIDISPFWGGMATRRKFILMLLLIVSQTGQAQNNQTCFGKVTDAKTQLPIEMALVYLPQLNRWTLTNSHGEFQFTNLTSASYVVQIQCLGYSTYEQTLSFAPNTRLNMNLQPVNLQLGEVVVTATETQGGSTASAIDRMAMQQIQPSGFADLLQLMPGFTSQKRKMSDVSSIALREAGSDASTALGTAFYIDGMPLSNDAGLQYAHNSSSDLKISDRINVNNGIDLRQLSTDDIDRVEIVRGIPSVRHGNLTAGAVIVHRKWGYTPTTTRIKTDLNDKLIAIGKGVKLRNEKGMLNLNTEYLKNASDPRNPLETYTRSNTSIRFSRPFQLNATEIHLKTSVGLLLTADKEKTDPELNYGLTDYYKSDLTQYDANLMANILFQGKSAPRIQLKLSGKYSINQLVRERYVSPTGPMPLPTSEVAGKADAAYLRQGYNAHLLIDGKPLNVYGQLNYESRHQTLGGTHQLSTGVEYRLDKNFGQGEVYDRNLPPFPSGQTVRPRAFSDIPALQTLSVYAEDEFNLKLGKHKLQATAGLRASTLPGLAQTYAMHGQWYAEPRANLTWQAPTWENAHGTKHQLSAHVAWGRLAKTPTIGQLYPAPRYFDIIELNYYSQNPNLRRLYVLTHIEDPTNYNLAPAVNIKKEVGISWKWGAFQSHITYFDERMDNGFNTNPSYFALTHNQYAASSVSPTGLTAPPALDLFTYTETTRLYAVSMYTNLRKVYKQGLEYQFILPKIQALGTRITIDGAWFNTRYGNNAPGTYGPSTVINGEPFPYIGIYLNSNSDNSQKQLLNTNVQFDTHIPQYRLLVSITVETIWYEESQYELLDEYPDLYLDNFGNYHPFTQEALNDPILKQIVRQYSDAYGLPSRTAIDMGMNLKVSKELGDKLRMSFFVNRLLNYLPDYKSKFGSTMTRSETPYFGMELNFSL